MKKVRLVSSGAGASAIACLTLLVELGLPRENIIVTDRTGVVYEGRNEGMDPAKAQFAADTKARTLEDAIKKADVFLGLSGPGVLNKALVKTMSDSPLILALANPTPEIMPEEAREAQPDAVICTGRSDYPNQVNNVLCFPFIFRGALDVGATTINEAMKLACVKALADLTRAEISAEVAAVYGDTQLEFGPEYLIPKPFDPRLIIELPIAVAKAAMDSGVATRPIEDFNAYRHKLEQYVFKTGFVMRPIFGKARKDPKRIAFAEGEEQRVLRATQIIVDEGLAKPILVGREEVINNRIEKLGLRLQKDKDFELVNPENDPRYDSYWRTYHEKLARDGVSPPVAKRTIRTSNTAISAMLVHMGDADGVICGTVGRYRKHLNHIHDIIGLKDGAETFAALSVLVLNNGTFFISDPYVNDNPTDEQIYEMTIMAVKRIRRFGIAPKIALLSHSDFGSHNNEAAQRMRSAVKILHERAPELEVDGEMHADCALSQETRDLIYPDAKLKDQANLLIMPNIDAANISFNMLKILGEGITIGPLLMGAAAPVNILTPSVTARGIVNAAALTVVEAQDKHGNNTAEKVSPIKKILRI